MTNAERYAKEYLGKIFYFCLKKTGNDADANELASDIGYEVISSFSRGTSPENFDAWVLAIARRRWAKFAKRKYYGSPEQIDLGEVEDKVFSDDDVERDVLLAEDLETLRRELAFIRADYRNILVAHYIDEISVSKIAASLGIPVGTVKTRLQSSRKILKEGMNMARTFGTRSYKPEDIDFSCSGVQLSDLPWSAINRKIPKNILLEANNNPSTVEELAMELGIALPYMEEEVEILERGELLKNVDGDKYVTSFFISPRECQHELDRLCYKFAERNYKALWELAGKAAKRAKEIGATNGTVADEDVQMYFVGNVGFRIYLSPFSKSILVDHFHRKDGGTWGLMGYEKGANIINRIGFNNSYDNRGDIYLGGYFITGGSFGDGAYDQMNFEVSAKIILKALAQSGGNVSDFSENDMKILNELIKCNLAVETNDGKVLPRVIVIGNKISEIMQPVWADAENERMKSEMRELVAMAKDVIARYSTNYLKDDFEFYVAQSTPILCHCANLIAENKLYNGSSSRFLALMY